MELSNPSEDGISLNDDVNTRLKNRERQRRYREKKRRRVETSEANENQSTQMQIIVLPTDHVPVVQTVTRVYCKRDWKKDARRVHALNREAASSAENDQTSENVRRKLCRRDWKAEARSKGTNFALPK